MPGTFLTISKQWGSGDQLSLQLPIHLRTEAIKGLEFSGDQITSIFPQINTLV